MTLMKWPEPEQEELVGPNPGEEVKEKKEKAAPPLPTIGAELAGILKGKSEEDLKKIFGEDVPENVLETLSKRDTVKTLGTPDQGPVETRGTI